MFNSKPWWKVCVLIIVVICLFGCASVPDQSVRDIVKEELRLQERRQVEEWEKMLMPMYEDMGMKYNKNPKSLKELLEPLFGLLKSTDD